MQSKEQPSTGKEKKVLLTQVYEKQITGEENDLNTPEHIVRQKLKLLKTE